MDTELGASDRLVLVAEDDSAVEFGGLVAVPEPAAAQAPTGRARLTAAAESTHIAVIGWSGFGAKVLKELDEFLRSEEHTSELQSLMRISYAVFCLKKKK